MQEISSTGIKQLAMVKLIRQLIMNANELKYFDNYFIESEDISNQTLLNCLRKGE